MCSLSEHCVVGQVSWRHNVILHHCVHCWCRKVLKSRGRALRTCEMNACEVLLLQDTLCMEQLLQFWFSLLKEYLSLVLEKKMYEIISIVFVVRIWRGLEP